MTSLHMAILHIKRQKLQSTLMIISLSIALGCSTLLLRIYNLSQSRYEGLPRSYDAILGPKSGGIEILLGSLNLESKFHRVIPENIFLTLRAGVNIQFEDQVTVPSKNYTQSVIPICFIGDFNGNPVIATDRSFFTDSDLEPLPTEIWIGSQVSEKNNLKLGDEVTIQVHGTISKKTISKKLKVGKILSEQRNSWDRALFVSQSNSPAWLLETESNHPVWKNRVLDYILFKMDYKVFPHLQSLINDRSVSQLIWVDSEMKKLEDLTSSAKDIGVIFILVIFALAGFSIFGMILLQSQSLRVSAATLEAIGYLPQYIYKWLFSEFLILGFVSSFFAISLQVFAYNFISSTLDSTWIVTASQSSSLTWIFITLVAGIVFSLIGALASSWQMYTLQIHSELKSG